MSTDSSGLTDDVIVELNPGPESPAVGDPPTPDQSSDPARS